MMYQLLMTYDDGTVKKEKANLPSLMAALGIYMEDKSWCFAEITNCQTGEVLAAWMNNPVYGATTID